MLNYIFTTRVHTLFLFQIKKIQHLQFKMLDDLCKILKRFEPVSKNSSTQVSMHLSYLCGFTQHYANTTVRTRNIFHTSIFNDFFY